MNNPKKRPREFKEEANNSEKKLSIITRNENDRTAGDRNPIPTTEMTSGSVSSDSNEKDDTLLVRGLRLEAIFHPKFDNERNKKGAGKKGKGNAKDDSDDIRNTMLRKLGILRNGGCTEPTGARRGSGHLEVSLKHSGSLVLWSGSTRYYSKNSACNEFTRTAEILLRQRFEIVKDTMLSSTSTTDTDSCRHTFRSYEDCSRFVSHNRYTVAFEVVTAEMLGDHGQVPNIDYVVVTAVADRGQERFLSTTEVLEFCHRFRLPHNDVWTFFPPPASTTTTGTGIEGALSSAETLFQMYDNSLREFGYTENTVETLTKIADVYIPSPIPHSIFQGSICEGFIVRYVDDASGGDGVSELRKQLEGLAQTARGILKEIPPPAPSSLSAERPPHLAKSDLVLDTDLRALFRSISNFGNGENEKSQQQHAIALQRQRAAKFSESLKEVLQDGNGYEDNNNVSSGVNKNDDKRLMERTRRLRRVRHDLRKIEKEQKHDDSANGKRDHSTTKAMALSSFHLPTLTKNLVESRDRETRRIATLLQTLDGLKGGAVRYAWMEKQDEASNSTNKQTRQERKRLYCTIHVCNDSTFFKFQSLQSPSEMTLFRGFCVEVLLSSSVLTNDDRIDWGEEEIGDSNTIKDNDLLWKPQSSLISPSSTEGDAGAPLMLKMKLLPYMVRTFICRNLLNTIQQKGSEEFERIASGLFEKWKISSGSMEHWMPFFRGWALYVLQYKAENENREAQIEKEQKQESKDDCRSSSDDALCELGNLTNFSYLRHLEHFTKLYGSGDFRTASSVDIACSPEFHTFICFVSQSTEVSLALANRFANLFNALENKTSEETTIAEPKMTVCSLGEAAKNHRSKSVLAYANVSDMTKGIKKFICDKKVVKRSVLVLFGSNKDEIIALTSSGADKLSEGENLTSWMGISSASDGKKLVGMWKSWKKFPCAKRFELGRSFVQFEPKREDSTVAEISSFNDTKEIIDGIRELGRSLIEQENKKKSGPIGGGLLVFFPGIPGCGKSSLVESSRPKVEKEMFSRKKETGDRFDRDIHIKEGDKIGKNFWNLIEDHLSDENTADGKSPALVIADKNAPPASWQKLGQISNETNAIMLPVLPDASALETTTIQGSILPDGTLFPHASHFYPFSLTFLAVALSRVLSRPAGEHSGKLDSGFPMACMVVVQFFSFYRYIGADTFQEKLREKFDKDGAFSITILKPVQLPFLTAAAQEERLPDDLKELLVEALQLRHGHDKNKKFKVKKEDPQMIDLEKRMRSSIELHKGRIDTLTVSLEESNEAFASQIMERLKYLGSTTHKIAKPSLTDSTEIEDLSNTVKLVSIDIDRAKIQKLLQKYRESGALEKFFDYIKSFSPQLIQKPRTEDGDTVMTDANGMDPNFVDNTHVTMAFAGENHSAQALISKFRHLQGRGVEISVTGFLWSSTNAALAIKIASSTSADEKSCSVPACENSFAHITVWVAPDAKKSLSNQLPDLIESKKASCVDFDQEDVLVGTISFWNHKNEPFRV